MGPADRPEERWRGYPDRTRFRRRSSPPPGAKTGSDTGGGVRAAMGLHSVRPSHGAIARRVSPTRSAGELRDPERLSRRSPRVVSDRCRRTAGDHPRSCAGPSPSASEEVWTFIARQNRRHRGRSPAKWMTKFDTSSGFWQGRGPTKGFDSANRPRQVVRIRRGRLMPMSVRRRSLS